MNIKNALLSGVLLASCSSKTPVHQGAAPAGPETPVTSTDSAPAQHPQGTITSSGGYLYGFETNPWFLENTSEVKYCLEIDEENFGLSRDASEKLIKESIQLWKDKLSTASYSNAFDYTVAPYNHVKIGSQNFVMASCDDPSVDLRFQFGKLDEYQHQLMGDPRRFVANTYETSYDQINMKGGGFIYLAPESGNFRPIEEGAHKKFWSATNGLSALYVITHELGHVFGFNHLKFSIMDEQSPQHIISNDSIEEIAASPSYFRSTIDVGVEGMFGFSETAQMKIYSHENLNVLFGNTSGSDHVLKCVVSRNYRVDECAVFELKLDEFGITVESKVGILEIAEQRSISFPFLTVKLPSNQNVFQITGSTNVAIRELSAIDYRAFWVSGVYKSLIDGIRVPMTIESRYQYPNDLSVQIVVDGVITKI